MKIVSAVRFKVCLFFSAGLSITALQAQSAWAQPAVVAEAQRQLVAGNPKQAYVLLSAKQAELSGDVEFDYLLGVAALDSGKFDEAIIAFERVLAVNPRNAGAQLDLARAYFLTGSLDLSEATFVSLRASNPPPAAEATIAKYLEAIASRRKAKRRALYAWNETSLGFDSNITGVPNDFTSAVASAFNLSGVNPTGNSVKRRAPYLGAALGADVVLPFADSWNALLGAEVRGRAYRKQAAFNSLYGEAYGGLGWMSGAQQWRFTASGSRYSQDGLAPGDPRPTNDRKSGLLTLDYRYALSPGQQVNAAVSGVATRFLANEVEDFDSVLLSLGWLKAFAGKGQPLVQLSGFYSRDEAKNLLADGVTDKSKRVSGLRGYGQVSVSEKLSIFNSLGYTLRRDQSRFARATEVEIGRDKLADVTLGVNLQFQPKCNMRAQWSFAKNNSNIAIYDYSRHEVSSNIRCEFE
ncbi:MAG: tetratricopeptide repeat protein [Betaproteobacteria bacterium]|nr:tetratricopeptide repeat protein [Betaproteobacteria bacterium]